MAPQKRIYLDHNASTPLAPEAAEAMTAALSEGWTTGNPSSIHSEGRLSRDLLETARRQVATLIGAAGDEIVFASSGTEAITLGVIGTARASVAKGAPPRILVGATEHPCVLGAARALGREGFAVAPMAVTGDGVLDLDRVRAQIAGGAALIAVALANHEVGTIQPVAEVAALAEGTGARVFCDAVQAAGKIHIEAAALGVDALAISAHKFYGPKGVGALWLSPSLQIEAVLGGGHQERERRPGTENVLGVVGAGAAALRAQSDIDSSQRKARELGEAIELWVDRLGGETIGAGAGRIANTTCARFPGCAAEILVQALDLAGFAASAGAACTSGKLEPSPVLLAMGYGETEATEAIRLSTGRGNEPGDIEALNAALTTIVQRIGRLPAP